MSSRGVSSRFDAGHDEVQDGDGSDELEYLQQQQQSSSASVSLQQIQRHQGRLRLLYSRYSGLCGLLLGLVLGSVVPQLLMNSHDNKTLSGSSDSSSYFRSHESSLDGPTFVFHIGIEGTGHHFIQALLRKAPAVQAMNKAGANVHMASIRRDFLQGLMMPYCDKKEMADPQKLYKNMTASLRAAKELLKDMPHSHIPINTLNPILESDNHELSYPDSSNCNRIKHPNLDMFYSACDDAKVKCGAVYLYRDPYAVVRSNQNRHFNKNVQAGIHLYTMMLQVVYAQLSYAPERTLACIGLYDDDAPDEERWHPIRDMYGWDDAADAFAKHVESVYVPHAPFTQADKDDLVPPAYRPHMQAMVRAHDKVIEKCRELVRDNNMDNTTKSIDNGLP